MIWEQQQSLHLLQVRFYKRWSQNILIAPRWLVAASCIFFLPKKISAPFEVVSSCWRMFRSCFLTGSMMPHWRDGQLNPGCDGAAVHTLVPNDIPSVRRQSSYQGSFSLIGKKKCHPSLFMPLNCTNAPDGPRADREPQQDTAGHFPLQCHGEWWAQFVSLFSVLLSPIDNISCTADSCNSSPESPHVNKTGTITEMQALHYLNPPCNAVT